MTDPYEIAAKAATDFPPTLDQKELEDKVFCIKGARLVTTKFGQKYVGIVQLNGTNEDVEAWLGGVRVNRQLHELQEAGALPAWFKLVRDKSIEGEPYSLEKPDEVPAIKETWAKKLQDLGKEYALSTERALELLGWRPNEGERLAACYKRGVDELVKSAGSRDGANRLIYEELLAQITGGANAPEDEDYLPFE